MRWPVIAIALFGLFRSACAQEETTVEILTRNSVLEYGGRRALYCQVRNLKEGETIEWLTPDNNTVPYTDQSETDLYVEKKELTDKTLLGLYFRPAKLSHIGTYTCKVGTISKSMNVIVGHKVQLDAMQTEVQADEGKTVKLKWQGYGIPEPTPVFYKEGKLLRDDPKKYYISKKGNYTTLEIKALDWNDTAAYTCKMTQNELSHYTNKTIYLYVRHKPVPFKDETRTELVDISSKNDFDLATMKEEYAILNETKNITCSAYAYPRPTFSWSRRKNNFDLKITDEDRIFDSEDGMSSTLLLKMRTVDDATMYKCTVTNAKGHLDIFFDISLTEKPPVPSEIYAVGANATYIRFNVTCENCTFAANTTDSSENGPDLPVIGYLFELVRYEEKFPAAWDEAQQFVVDVKDSQNTVFEIGPLDNTTTYHVRVASVNSGGPSDWLEMTNHPSTTDIATRLYVHVYCIVLFFVALTY